MEYLKKKIQTYINMFLIVNILNIPYLVYSSGGTAVGTGLNSRIGFAEKVAAKIAEETCDLFTSLNISV